jgi:hypothetical protein
MSAPEEPQAPARKWSWRKKLLVWGGVSGALVGIVALVIFGLTKPLVQTADGFFDDIKSGALDRAYERVSNDFKRASGVDEFREQVAKYGLNAVKTTSWSSRNMRGFGEGSLGELDGTATDADGTVRPVSMRLVKEGGVWRIQGLSIKPAGVTSPGQTREMPNERELVRMTHDIVVAFSRSLSDKSMKTLHEAISERWRREQSVESLEAAFKEFLDRGVDLTKFESLTPVFDGEPKIDEQGWLVVNGYYETPVERLEFEQTFLPEGLGWKLGGLSINVKPRQQG